MYLSCPYDNDTAQSTNIINLSQLHYIKSECHVEEGACHLCQELPSAEKDVEAAIMQLKAALNRHQRLKTDINLAHSPVISDLPVEILARIFYACFSEDMQKYGEPIYEDCFVPLKVGAVCRTWRQIAWSSPELWTVISMKRVLSPAFHVCKQYGLMEGWIERSGALPLWVYLEEDVDHPDLKTTPEACRPCWERCLHLLKKISERWEVAYLNLSLNSFVHIVHRVKIKPPTRRLALQSPDEMWYHVQDQGDLTDSLKPWDGSSYGPKEVTLSHPIRLGHVAIDWHCVTHVEVQEWPLAECVNLLRHAPRLESCSLIRVGRFPQAITETIHGGPVVPVNHNSLRYLYIECNNSPAIFFDEVTLPSLEELDYSHFRGGYFPDEAIRSTFLREFIARSCCPLKKLSLYVPPFTPIDYLDTILQLLPTLVHFDLHFSTGLSMTHQREVFDHLLLRLITTASIEDGNGTSKFLPKLEILELDCFGLRDDDVSYWIAIVDVFGDLGKEGRRPFSCVTVNDDTPHPVKGLPDDVVDRLVDLQKAGAVIEHRVRSKDGYYYFVPVKWA
ncbi:hypothetical protein D9613_004475 [Agrocybe pediades]|uniref:F-box domain-containing protein n=1 Tax=Agrocybe pediades TaxID=84607 RepID=A0A8H4QIP6_9AGAR|nr:hypothetical protein D9613_004475 [Agrocybe pediades]